MMTDLDTLRGIASCHPDVRAFIFGSYSRGVGQPRDIDILALYQDHDDRRRFRAALDAADFDLTIDLIEMTPQEERHFDFIALQRAIPILGLP